MNKEINNLINELIQLGLNNEEIFGATVLHIAQEIKQLLNSEKEVKK